MPVYNTDSKILDIKISMCNIYTKYVITFIFCCCLPPAFVIPTFRAQRPCVLNGLRGASVPQGDRDCRARREGRVEGMRAEMYQGQRK